MTDTTTIPATISTWHLTSLLMTESMEERDDCFNRTKNSEFTDNFVVFKKTVNIYFVGIAIIIGLVGNTLSVIVLRHDRLADAKQRSATNHLLRMLAIVDSLYLITCIFIQTLKTIIENTEWFPGSLIRHHYLHIEPLVWVFSSAAQTSTVWLVLLVTIDRYLAVCKPWKSSWRSTRFVITTVATMTLLALMYNLPRFFERVVITRRLCSSRIVDKTFDTTSQLSDYNRTNASPVIIHNLKSRSEPDQNHSGTEIMIGYPHVLLLNHTKSNGTTFSEGTLYITRTLRTEFRNNKIYFLVYKTVMYFVFRSFGPLIMMLFCNWRLVSDLRKVRKRRRDMLSRRVQHKENITIMLVVVVTVFIICQIPALAVRVAVTIMEFNQSIKLDLQILRYINELSNALLTVNSSINFIIYCLVGKKFQKSFMSMISCTSGTNEIGQSEDCSKTAAPNRSTIVAKHPKESVQLERKVVEHFIINAATSNESTDKFEETQPQ